MKNRIRGMFLGASAGKDNGKFALLVAESLIKHKEINLDDLARRHAECLVRKDELNFSTTTEIAIVKIAKGIHWSKSGRGTDSRNGFDNDLLLKIAPLGAFRSSSFWQKLWVEDRRDFINNTASLALMTHYSRMAIDSALIHLFAINYCLENNFSTKKFIARICQWSDFFLYDEVNHVKERLSDRLAILDKINPLLLTPEEIINFFGSKTDYIYDSLPLSYALFLKNPYSTETMYEVMGAGKNRHTNASIVGGLLGALNGESIFPPSFIDSLTERDKILETADRFYTTFFTQNTA